MAANTLTFNDTMDSRTNQITHLLCYQPNKANAVDFSVYFKPRYSSP